MRPNRPSRTAHLVAFARAMADKGLSHVPDFRDPTAQVFLNEKAKRSLAKVGQEVIAGNRSFRIEATRGMADMMALRTLAIDTAVRDAVTRGARQLVILGAGYDGRAWRMSELAGVKVFEVDREETQKDKRVRAAELLEPIGNVTFVPIDFEKESLDLVLERAGHDATVPTCWIWEGVVMYLTRDAVRDTLAAIAKRSSGGSTLIVNYHTAHRGIFGRLMLRLIGEPQLSSWSPEEMSAELNAVGFAVREDSAMTDFNERFANGEANVQRGYYMRIVVASKI